jgi:uncharacterized protein (TIGR02099 family)
LKFARTRNALLWIWHQLLIAGLIALLLLAVYVGVGRQLMPMVGDYKGRLEARLSADAGVVVRIGKLRGQWDGLTPIFIADDIEIRDPHHPQQLLTRLPRFTTRPALLASLVNREPRLSSTLQGLSLHLVQQPDGRIQVAELSSLESTDPEAAHQAIGLLLRQPSLVLSESRIVLDLSGKPSLVLAGLDMTSINEGAMHWLKGSFHLPHSLDAVSLVLKYRGDPLDWRQGRLQTWISLPGTDLSAWLAALPLPEVSISQARLGGQYWFDFQQGSLLSITGQISLPAADVVVRGTPVSVHQLSGLLAWQREKSGWVLAAEQLTGKLNGHSLPAPRFALRNDGHVLELTAAQLALAPLRELLQGSTSLPPAARNWLAGLAPAGWVPHLRLTLQQGEDGSLGDPAVRAEFKALDTKAYRGSPALSHFSGWLSLDSRGGLLYLGSRGTALDLKAWFHEPLLADSFEGGLRLRQEGKVWRVDSSPLHISNADASADALLTLLVPQDKPAAARMDLAASLHQARAASAWRYVPWPVAGDETLAWLKSAITAGTVETGSFLYDGPLNNLRGEPPGRLQMRFQMRDVRLAYQPGWPAIEGMSGGLVIDGTRLSATAEASHVYATAASNVTADIPDLDHPVLSVSANLKGPAADVMRLFRDSPLKADVGAVPAALAVQGDVSGHLDLQVPFDARPLRVSVSADLPGNTLTLTQQQLPLENARGQLIYTSAQGLVSHRLQGKLFDEPVEVHIASQLRGNALSLVHVTVEGHAGVPALQRWSGLGLLKYMEGGSDYQADVLIPGDSSRNGQLIISSNLDGLRVNLPAPFGKGMEPLPLRYQSDIGEGELNARLSVGRRINIGLLWDKGRVKGAAVRAGTEGNAPVVSNGIALDLNVPRFSVADWQKWLADSGVGAGVAEGSSELPPLNRLTVESRELLAQGYVLRNARVDARRDGEGWQLGFKSERMDGSARVVLAGKSPGINVMLDRLQWPLPTAAAAAGKADSPTLEPGSTPILLQVKALALDQWPDLNDSQLSARISPTPQGLRADQIFIINLVFNFTGSLDWNWRDGVRTHISGELKTSDAGKLLSQLGYTPLVDSKDMSATLTDFNWAGEPADFSVDKLNGQFGIRACNKGGRLLNVGTVTSASRIFGLFDIDNIKQRLQFNFSDITKKGVSFDKASLSAQLHDGVMLPARFAFTGPSMSANGQGRVDLNQSLLDQQISVSVPVTSALPVVATVLGGPLVGGSVLAMEKALDKQLGKLTTLHYHITGNWDNPQVEHGTVSTGNDKAEAEPECKS